MDQAHPPSINDLDDDALLEIFGHLHRPKYLMALESGELYFLIPQLANFVELIFLLLSIDRSIDPSTRPVCKRWNNLMSRFWRQLTHFKLQPERKIQWKSIVREQELLTIVQKCPNIHRLNLNRLSIKLSQEGFYRLGQLCPHVEELNLDSARCDFVLLLHLLCQFPLLKKINLKEVQLLKVDHLDMFFGYHPHLIDFVCPSLNSESNILRSLRSPLQKYSMHEVTGGGDELLSCLVHHCRQSLQILEIGFGERWLEGKLIDTIFRNFRLLTELTLRLHDTQSLANLSTTLPHLTRLGLFCKWDENVNNFLQSYPQLISLKTDFEMNESFRQAVKLLPNLLHFTNYWLTMTGQHLTLIYGWNRLESVELNTSPALECQDYCQLVQNMPSLKKVIIWDVELIVQDIFKHLQQVLANFEERKLWVEYQPIYSSFLLDPNYADHSLESYLNCLDDIYTSFDNLDVSGGNDNEHKTT